MSHRTPEQRIRVRLADMPTMLVDLTIQGQLLDASLPATACLTGTWTVFTGCHSFLCLIRPWIAGPDLDSLNRRDLCRAMYL